MTAGDIDLDDDFTPAPAAQRGASPTISSFSATPVHQGFARIQTATQQSAGFGTQGGVMAPPAAKPQAAAGNSSSGPPGYTLLMTGGLAGFSGRPSAILGCRVSTPALVGCDPSSNPDYDICGSSPVGFRQGFAAGGLNEGLAGLTGAQGVGLRVLVALSPACGPDAAQGLLQLWRHVSGVTGGAPRETLLEGLVEAMTAAVCAGMKTSIYLPLSELLFLYFYQHVTSVDGYLCQGYTASILFAACAVLLHSCWVPLRTP